jgi:hypothetical protein
VQTAAPPLRPGAPLEGDTGAPVERVVETILGHVRPRRPLLARLARVERALRRRDAWEATTLVPDAPPRPMPPLALHREGRDGLRRMLAEELARLDGTRPADI